MKLSRSKIRCKARGIPELEGEVQLDLFIPSDYGYAFKVVVTNKTSKIKTVVAYHEGRGSQEGIFGDLKSQCQMGYVPVRTRAGNQVYLLATLFAHNLVRELQMATSPPDRHTTVQRAPLWIFEKLDTLRRTVIQRAGRLTRPHGRLTLTIGGGEPVKRRLLQTLDQLRPAA